MSASWASHLYAREICGCVEKVGVGGHGTQGIFTCTKFVPGNQVRPKPLLTQSILNISESVTRSKVREQCLRRREAK
jgi:hypothetical protein